MSHKVAQALVPIVGYKLDSIYYWWNARWDRRQQGKISNSKQRQFVCNYAYFENSEGIEVRSWSSPEWRH